MSKVDSVLLFRIYQRLEHMYKTRNMKQVSLQEVDDILSKIINSTKTIRSIKLRIKFVIDYYLHFTFGSYCLYLITNLYCLILHIALYCVSPNSVPSNVDPLNRYLTLS